MKLVLKFLLSANLFLASLPTAWAVGSHSENEGESAQGVAGAEAIEQEQFLAPPLSQDEELIAFESDAPTVETAEEVSTADRFRLRIVINHVTTIELPTANYDPNIISPFSTLSPEKQEKFLKIRKNYVTGAAKILSYSKLALGMGSLISDKIKQYYRASKSVTMKVLRKPHLMAVDVPLPKRSLNERAAGIIQRTLEAIDRKLWTEAKLIVAKNETLLTIGLSPLWVSGIGNKVRGGSVEVGIHIGYSSDTKGFVFEVYSSSEKIVYGFGPVLAFGLTPKIGVLMTVQDADDLIMKRVGSMYYPTLAPTYTGTMTNSVVIGTNYAPSTVPPMVLPPVMADASTYRANVTRTTVLRISLSLRQAGFIRIATGIFKRAKPIRIESIEEAKSCADVLKTGSGDNT